MTAISRPSRSRPAVSTRWLTIGLFVLPALVLYAAFGSSRHLVVGPMSATAALSASTVAQFVAPGSGAFVAMTAALAIATGAVALIAGLARLGFLANFISEPVLKGFIVGLALTIIIGQVPKLFGIEGGEGDFFEKLWDVVSNLGDTDWRTLAVGLLSLAVVLGLRRFAAVVPGSLVAVALGVAAVKLLSSSQADTFTVVLYMAISTTLVSYILIFPALIKLRYSHATVPRVFSVPGGKGGLWAIGLLCTAWTLMGSWVAIFPDTLEYVFGADYNFVDSWGVSRLRFEVFTLGTLAVVIAFALVGYLAGRSVREQVVDVPLAATPAPAAGD